MKTDEAAAFSFLTAIMVITPAGCGMNDRQNRTVPNSSDANPEQETEPGISEDSTAPAADPPASRGVRRGAVMAFMEAAPGDARRIYPAGRMARGCPRMM